MAYVRHLSCPQLFTCIFVICVISVAPGCGFRRFNIYNKYYVEDNCKKNEKIAYGLDGTGKLSAIKIGARRTPLWNGPKNCTVTVRPPVDYGVILHVHSFNFGSSSYLFDCSDYIQIFGDAGNSTRLCGYLQPNDDELTYLTKGSTQFSYRISGDDDGTSATGFTLIATAYQLGELNCSDGHFRCNSGHCIWEGFVCDGIPNCPDGSDEWITHLSKCGDTQDFTFAPFRPIDIKVPTYRFTVAPIGAAVTCSFIVLTVALIRFFCYYHCVRLRRREALGEFVVTGPPAANDPNFQSPPPPYTVLINEPAPHDPSVGENPPPYTPRASAPVPTNGTERNTTRPKQSINASAVAGSPPPPYEP